MRTASITRGSVRMAVAALVALALSACGDGGDDAAAQSRATSEVTEVTAQATSTADATTSTSSTTEATTSASGQPGEGSDPSAEGSGPAATVEAWVDALGAGDLDAAWALTTPSSQDSFGGREAFDESASGLAEGYGSWSGSTDATFTAVALDDVEPGLSLVVLRGTVAQEGPPEPAVEAVPVRSQGHEVLVDPFHDLVGRRSLEYDPAAGTAIAADPTFVVYAPVLLDARFVIDGDQVLEPTSEGADGDQLRFLARLDEPLGPGHHSLTVVLLGDGEVQADAVLYTVEG